MLVLSINICPNPDAWTFLQACAWGVSCSFPQHPPREHAGSHVLLLLPTHQRDGGLCKHGMPSLELVQQEGV